MDFGTQHYGLAAQEGVQRAIEGTAALGGEGNFVQLLITGNYLKHPMARWVDICTRIDQS